MSTTVIIQYPIEGTLLFSDELRVNYKLSSYMDPSVKAVYFKLDEEEKIDELNDSVTFTNVSKGMHTLSGYLIDKNNRQILNTNFSVNFETNDSRLNVEQKITYVLESTIPGFVKEDFPNFVIFLKAYYEWLYSSNNPFYAPIISEDYKDLDKTPEYFIKYFKEQYLKDFPESLTFDKESGTPVNIKTLMKNIVDFYSSKGTEKSIKFLIKILYDTYSEVYYPKRDLFRGSDSKWNKKTSIKFTSNSQNIHEIKDLELVQKSGETLTFRTKIDEVQVYFSQNKKIIEVFYSKTSGSLNFSYPFEVSTPNEVVELSPVLVVSSIEIENSGINYKINDLIKIQKINTNSDPVDVSFAKITEVDQYGQIVSLDIVNFLATQDIEGSYYFTITSENGTGAVLVPVIGYICEYSGFWTNKNSHPSSIKVLQDNLKYQEMSYVVRTNRSLDKYVSVLKKLAHPAGFAVVGDVLIQNMLVEPTEIQDIFLFYYTPLIGNYAAYRIQTSLNIRDTNQKTDDLYPNGFDPTQPNPLQDDPNNDDAHVPASGLLTSLASVTKFKYLPVVSDIDQKNNYWVQYPHPNTEINNGTDILRFMDIKLEDFLKQERSS
jgi:hypothetical protein